MTIEEIKNELSMARQNTRALGIEYAKAQNIVLVLQQQYFEAALEALKNKDYKSLDKL